MKRKLGNGSSHCMGGTPVLRMKRRGAAILETALVLILLLSLTFGAVEMGYYFWVKHACEGIAWTVARAAIPANATATDAQTAYDDAVSASGLSSDYFGTLTITPGVNAATGESVKVTVSFNWKDGGFNFLSGLVGVSLGDHVTAEAVMRKEGA